jgi:hypothetical protein
MSNLKLADTLERADKKIWSCGCPYLALSDEVGYLTMHDVKSNPSNFGRLSMSKIMRYAGLDTDYSQFVYECLECGKSLDEVSKYFRVDDETFAVIRRDVRELYLYLKEKYEC